MKNNTQESVLIINDITAYGRVSSLAMLPVFNKYLIHPYILPTAIVSNATDYGSCEILDTTSFMRNCIQKWNMHGFKFKNISTGLLNSSEQLEIILDLIEKVPSPTLLVDPIMADNGELYSDIYTGIIPLYRTLAKKATILVPNFTEATLLTSMFENRNYLNDSEYIKLCKELKNICPGEIIITGCKDEFDKHFNIVYTQDGQLIKLNYNNLHGKFVGTGDIFSACMFSEYIKGKTIIDATQKASDFIIKILNANINNPDHFDLRIEEIL